MAVEIELKANIDDIEPLKERLSAIGKYCRSYQKTDTYWLSPKAYIPRVRVRREQGIDAIGAAYESAIVTMKAKRVSEGNEGNKNEGNKIEVNDEREFSVSDAALFEELLHSLDMRKAMHKEKNGWAWLIPPEARQPGAEPPTPLLPILAELSLVTNLGWFLELEIVCSGNCRQEVAESRERLLALLARLEVPASRIEDRPYAEMLRAQGNAAMGIL